MDTQRHTLIESLTTKKLLILQGGHMRIRSKFFYKILRDCFSKKELMKLKNKLININKYIIKKINKSKLKFTIT